MKGTATLRAATLQPGISFRRAEVRWFCKAVMSHDSDDTLLTSTELEDTKHNFFHPLKTDGNKVHDVLYRCRNEEIFTTLETTSGTHDFLVEAQSHEICNILSSGDWNSQGFLQPFVKCLSIGLVARVLNQLTNVEMAKLFFYWAAKQDGYKHNVFLYNTLLMKLGLAKRFDDVWKVLKRMLSEDCDPTSTTFAIIIQSYRKVGNSQWCLRDFKEAKRLGIKLDARICTALTCFLFDARNAVKANQLFSKMMEGDLELDIHIWSMVIHGLCEKKKMADAEIFYKQMQTSGCMPNADIYNTMILGFCESSNLKKVFLIYDLIQKQGFKPNTSTYNIFIKAL